MRPLAGCDISIAVGPREEAGGTSRVQIVAWDRAKTASAGRSCLRDDEGCEETFDVCIVSAGADGAVHP